MRKLPASKVTWNDEWILKNWSNQIEDSHCEDEHVQRCSKYSESHKYEDKQWVEHNA